ncbi:diaminopropionate ammonia-lyase [Marinobacter lutaoensis]|jgi:diaminopropionate ammonia-lyase|uniref:diaminopropionate ammonia-lyase n=1 Tax=Marinobacter lutaoensis TaxID=135739 RepID=UPI00159497CA|nr:diaminopropionate ammonia-lyase [Marinobacter lutaoensis]NVD36313.1 diaminopropionate ammonia-lyase [Marinobacter lutaoensis]
MSDIIQGEGLTVFTNPRAAGPDEAYGETRSRILSATGFDSAQAAVRAWPGYRETPLHTLPGLARSLGLGALYCKDEGARFELGSFKALGGAYAVFRLLQKKIAEHHDGYLPGPAEILSGAYRDLIRTVTVTCATDGNHGRSVAWGAQMFGCRCVIFIHASVSEGRRAAIARYGAEVVRVPGNYDEAVRHAAAEAGRNGWTVVSDTTWEGYRDIPVDVMHGYGVMSREIIRQLPEPPTHVLVQAGVGALAASVCAAFWQAWGPERPRFVVVEPEQAACHFASARAGHPQPVHGDLETVMAGLACGEVSPAAWEILSAGANDFVTVADELALEGMRVLAHPRAGDPALVAGETGTSGLAVLLAARNSPRAAAALGLDASARVLLICSEGATDPEIYRRVVGMDATEVCP